MGENEKPFACLTDGCNMRFTNEDHLTVHQKKHDMILNLGNGLKMNTFVADQTPTPTRFIRNCEEVGLFQDLQINPFDETFRKAVESGKAGHHSQYGDTLHLPTNTDDTLHTPHVFPFPNNSDDHHHGKMGTSFTTEHNKRKTSHEHLNRSVSTDSMNGLSSGPTSIIVPAETSIIQLPMVTNQPHTATNSPTPRPIHPTIMKRPAAPATVAAESKQETVRVAGQSMQLLLRMPDGKLVQLVQEKKPSPPDVTPIPTPENGLALAKMKLKQALTNNGRNPSASSEAKEVKPRAVVRVEPPSPSTTPQTARRESSNGSGEEGGDRKSKFRERNRAAAMRCREKRKTWVQELERRADEMQATNQQLQGEVTALRAEVAQLKTLLLAHKHCPITQAMNQGQMINVSTLPMETIQTCLLPTSQPSRIMYQSTASTSQPPSAFASLKEPASSPSPAKRQRLGASSPQRRTNTEARADGAPTNGRVINSVVVSNPIQSTSRANHPNNAPPYINFKHLLSACATNENNLNLEKSGAMLNHTDDSDGDSGEGSVIAIEETESKVIKLNPNVVRFRCIEEVFIRDVRLANEDQPMGNENGDDGENETEIIIDS